MKTITVIVYGSGYVVNNKLLTTINPEEALEFIDVDSALSFIDKIMGQKFQGFFEIKTLYTMKP